MPGANPVDVPFARGTNAVLRFFLDQGSGAQELIVRLKTWSVTKNVTDVVDDVGGEDASRLDTVANYWEVSGDAFYKDSSILEAALNDDANNRAGAAPLPKAISMKIVARDGSKFVGQFSQITMDATGIQMGSRTDAVMQSLKFRARYFKKGTSA